MIRLKNILTEIKYDYGCVMAQIPSYAASRFIDFGKKIITDDMLYFDSNELDDYGREKEPHVTIKFGLTKSYTREQMGLYLKGTRPFFITIGGIDIFENPKFDVIKLNVEGEDLFKLRKVFDTLPNTDDYKIYHPHMTLAYVKAGLGKKFKGKTIQSSSKILINVIKYSDRGNPIYFTL